jgi:5-(carboxyamino)imidazole ribonucleotide synthase
MIAPTRMRPTSPSVVSLPQVAGGTEASEERDRAPVVGFVGAGQLARMASEAASALGIRTAVLAEHPDDAATAVAGTVLIGSPTRRQDLAALAACCDVVTFDHELVDLTLVAELAAGPVPVRPGVATLEMATDKACMRGRLRDAGVPVPAFAVLPEGPDAGRATEAFAAEHGWPVVLKVARGGYDGRGVWTVDDPRQADAVFGPARANGSPLLVEAFVPFDAELAVMVARRAGGEAVWWPAVETAQVGGVCREVLVPGRLTPDVVDAACAVAAKVADVAGAVGVLAVELFALGGSLLVNEVAARPHNSGHWTIEGSVTSQFENHLRAVLDLPLGATGTTAPAVATVNVFGAADGSAPGPGLAAALAVEGAHVHRYGKAPRPGRKLGHVTTLGRDPDEVRRRAWQAARALGTPIPDGLAVPADPGGAR